MSSASDRSVPAFRGLGEEASLTRPLSGWAVLSLVLGISCLVVPISLSLIPLSILAILVGLIVTLRLSRPDADTGLWMSTLCLGLGLATAVWSVTASKTRAQHLSQHASKYAEEYMQLISSGQLYNAIELRLPFIQRQTKDVDLKAYYETYQGDVKVEMAAMGVLGDGQEEPQDPAKVRKTAFERLKIDPVTIYAMKYPDTQWKAVGIRSVMDTGKMASVKVIVQHDQDPKTQVLVELLRNEEDSTAVGAYAEWRVSQQELERVR